MGKRDRERRKRGDFIVRLKPPVIPKDLKELGDVIESAFSAAGIPNVWALRRPLPPEETDTEAHP